MNKIGILLLGISMICSVSTAKPVPEARGVWVEFIKRSWGTVSSAQVKQIVQDLHQNRFNMIFPLTREYAGKVIYPSKLAPASQPDILPLLVQEGHKKGVQVHAWMPCLIGGFLTPDPVLAAHPQWAVVFKDGKNCFDRPIDKCYWWYDPSNPEVREYFKSLVREIAAQHVDGINFDWLRINGDWCYSSTFRTGFRHKYGVDPLEIKTPEQEQQWKDYRVEVVSAFFQDLHDAAKSVNPKIKLSAAVAPDPEECKAGRNQDWLEWSKQLDFIFPMIYRHPDPSITVDAKRILQQAHCPVYIGLGGDESKDLSADSYAQMIQLVRASGARGFSFYRYDMPDKTDYLNRSDLEYFKKTVCRDKQ